MDEWSKNLLIKEICQIRSEHGRRKVKGLQRMKKQVLQSYFLQEISFAPGKYALNINACLEITAEDIKRLVKTSLPEVIRKKAS